MPTFLLCDTYTTQSSIYKKYGKVDQYHMMFGVNMWSTIMSLCGIILVGK
jgi:hypothetical protein